MCATEKSKKDFTIFCEMIILRNDKATQKQIDMNPKHTIE